MNQAIEENLQPDSDQDSAWKELLDEYFPAFVEFFFPHIHAEIDWTRGYESLDTELAAIRPAHASGKVIADKLFKVWLKNGKTAWLLIHVEVQERVTKAFARRLFIYNYRLLDKENHKVEVVSLAVLTGAGRGRTGRYETARWGCSTVFNFPCARIADYADRWEELEASQNIFAVVVMAQLKAHETKGDNAQRLAWKRQLLFSLYRRGFTREQIVNLFRFFDWVITLPAGLERQLQQEVFDYEEGEKVPFKSYYEILADERATQRGVELGLERVRRITQRQLEIKIGELGVRLYKRIAKLSIEQVEQLAEALLKFESKSDLDEWLKANPPQKAATRKPAANRATARAV